MSVAVDLSRSGWLHWTVPLALKHDLVSVAPSPTGADSPPPATVAQRNTLRKHCRRKNKRNLEG